MNKLKVVPLSVNRAFQGRRFKTVEYKKYEELCLSLLPNIKIPDKPLEVKYVFGFSNKLSDLGNPEKLITDILCKKYGFNDKEIFKMTLVKEIVKKGQEYIEFEIMHYV